MKFDFETVIDRSGQHELAVERIPIPDAAVDEGFSRIPMWVADMNFPTAPTVTEALAERISHPTFGYFITADEYYNAIIQWQKNRNGAEVPREAIGYENGVLGGLATALSAFCSQGDKILLHSPTYVGFTGTIKNMGYQIIHSPLVQDEKGVWRMDFDDMDRKLKENKIHFAVFCSPHNPCGRVWERWEIEKAMEIYRQNDCVVVSDEIWSDLILDDHRHIPTQSVSDDAKMRVIALYAPSKTFNLAGLIGSYHIIYNSYLRDRMARQASLGAYNHLNVLSMYALIGAYREEGAQWVDELRQVLSKNTHAVCQRVRERFNGVSVSQPEGTYMLYLNCEAWCRKHGKTMDELLRAGVRVGVIWQDGRPFGVDWTIRLNAALPHTLVLEALDRLEKYVFCAE